MNGSVKLAYVLAAHNNLVQDNRCMAGVKDENLLYSAIDGQYWYEPGIAQIIHVAYSICANHVFCDGNKRTAFLTLKLLESDLGHVCDWTAIAYVVLELAANSISKEEFYTKIVSAILI